MAGLAIGTQAPDFTLPDERGESVTLSEVLRRAPVVLYFYPADFTPVCTAQACMFRDVRTELAEAGVQVLGISPQGSGSHARFARKHSLSFPLLADPERRVIGAYGADGLLGLFTRRVSYFIDRDGTIRDRVESAWRVSQHRAFVERVLAAVRSR